MKFADTQRDKEQRRLQQQLVQQIQQLNSASTWGNLAGLGNLTPQYLAVSVIQSQKYLKLSQRFNFARSHIKKLISVIFIKLKLRFHLVENVFI